MGLLQYNPRGTRRIVIETILLALDFVVVGLRLWSRKLKRKSLELNDYAILVAMLLIVGAWADTVIVVVLGGEGRHTADILVTDPKMLLISAKSDIAVDLLFSAAITAIKVSALHLYVSIFGFPNVTFCRLTYIFMAICIIIEFGYIVAVFQICHPIVYYWDKSIAGTCLNQRLLYFVMGVINLFADVITVALPVPLVWGLQMPTTKKIAVTAIFGMGIFICILTGVRLKLATQITENDFSYSVLDFELLSSMEFYLGCINACLPLLSPALARIRDIANGRIVSLPFSRSQEPCSSSKSTKSIWTMPKSEDDSDQPIRNYRNHRYHWYPGANELQTYTGSRGLVDENVLPLPIYPQRTMTVTPAWPLPSALDSHIV